MVDSVVSQFKSAVEKLQAERAGYVSKIAEIDQAIQEAVTAMSSLADVPASTAPAPATPPRRGPGRPPKTAAAAAAPSSKKAGRTKKASRTRGKFKQTGEQTVIEFIRSAGQPTTAQINEHWRKQGRAGKADNTLGRLVTEGKLKRTNRPGERGSYYNLA